MTTNVIPRGTSGHERADSAGREQRPRLAKDGVQPEYLSLRDLASYSGLSVRRLRDLIADPAHPLPHYRPAGKILVRRTEFDAWMARYRQAGPADVERIVGDVLQSLRAT
jgi:excisionase family DNA binding protein